MVNHRPNKKDPTHYFDQCNSRHLPCLVPLRDAEKDEEYTFDYNQRKPGAKDVATVPDPSTSESEDESESKSESQEELYSQVRNQTGSVEL